MLDSQPLDGGQIAPCNPPIVGFGGAPLAAARMIVDHRLALSAFRINGPHFPFPLLRVFKIPLRIEPLSAAETLASAAVELVYSKTVDCEHGTARYSCGVSYTGAAAMTSTAKRAAIYLRVSTREQSTAMQRAELEAVAARAAWDVVEVYEDAGISGAKGRDQRPAFDRMLKDAARRRFNVVMVWALDRLGRSLHGLIETVMYLENVRVDLFVHDKAIDTTTLAGKLMFERGKIRERVQAGIDRARAAGKRLGRPTTDPKVVDQIRASLDAGVSIRKTAEKHGVGVSTVQAIKDPTGAAARRGRNRRQMAAAYGSHNQTIPEALR